MTDASFAAAARAPWRLRLPVAREAVLCIGLATTVGSLLVWLGPPGGDLAAHEYQRSLFLLHGFTLWDNFWYAGRYAFVGYSVLYYPLAALFGIQLLGVITVAVAAARLRSSSSGSGARRPWSARSFAFVFPGVPLAGEYPFALGAALALPRTRLSAKWPALDGGRARSPRPRSEPGRIRSARGRSRRDRRARPHASREVVRARVRVVLTAGGRAGRHASLPDRHARVSRDRGVEATAFSVGLLGLAWRPSARGGCAACWSSTCSPSSRSMWSRRGSATTSHGYATRLAGRPARRDAPALAATAAGARCRPARGSVEHRALGGRLGRAAADRTSSQAVWTAPGISQLAPEHGLPGGGRGHEPALAVAVPRACGHSPRARLVSAGRPARRHPPLRAIHRGSIHRLAPSARCGVRRAHQLAAGPQRTPRSALIRQAPPG